MWAGRAWLVGLVLVLVLTITQCAGEDRDDFAPPGPPDPTPTLSTPGPEPTPEPPVAERVGEQLRVVWEDLKEAARSLRRGFRNGESLE